MWGHIDLHQEACDYFGACRRGSGAGARQQLLSLEDGLDATLAVLTSICCLGGEGARLGGGGEALAAAWHVCADLRCCRVWAC